MAGMAAGGLAAVAASKPVAADDTAAPKLKGNVRHSACRWCYSKVPFETLCKEGKAMGLEAIDLLGPKEWPVAKKYGLTCSMAHGAGMGIEKGFNRPDLHDALVADFEALIPKVAEAGLTNLICMSGNHDGMSDEEGLKNCVVGIKRLIKTAEKHNVVLVMELLNSKVNHKGYMCDHTAWGVELCKQVGSDNFKLLYDIYHMQIMEGDLIRTIRDSAPYIAHYHTGGNPGRAEIDETQEIYYPAVIKAIVDTGYKGFIAQEFVPKSKEPLESLRKAVQICDV